MLLTITCCTDSSTLAFMSKRTISSDAVILFCLVEPFQSFFLQRFSHFDQTLPDKVYWLSGRLLPISSEMLSTAFTFSPLIKQNTLHFIERCKKEEECYKINNYPLLQSIDPPAASKVI